MEEEIKDFFLVLTDEARADILESTHWYEEKRPGLGDDFILNLDAVFFNILRNPRQFPENELGTRQALTKRFPYRVVYLIDESFIVVLAVVHTSRNPTVWQKRT